MPKPRPKIIHAAIAVIERDGHILICQRQPHDSFGGLWEFPGGKREQGETWEVCLHRELLEEVGVTVRNVTPFGWMRHQFRDGLVVFKIFRCALAVGEPKALEAQQVKWIRPSELSDYQFPPANKGMLARLSGTNQRRMV